jgi:hypothetical protein
MEASGKHRRFNSGETGSETKEIGGLVGPTTSLDAVGKRKALLSQPGIKPRFLLA